MVWIFYLSSVVAVAATALAITRAHAIHALLYFLVSLFATAMIFLSFGAFFIAALEVILYAGAIVVLFVFVVMLLNVGPVDRGRLRPGGWIGPAVLAAVIGLELIVALARGAALPGAGSGAVEPKAVAVALFGPYVLAVELVSFLLLAGLVGAYHVGSRALMRSEQPHGHHSGDSRSAPGGDPVPAGAGRSADSP
jgi:NADH-quinone oxidoreductase subunit J